MPSGFERQGSRLVRGLCLVVAAVTLAGFTPWAAAADPVPDDPPPPVGDPLPTDRLEPEQDGLIGLPMYHDPNITPLRFEPWFDPALLKLWLAGLAQPDTATRLDAARSIRMAVDMGVDPDVLAPAIDPLTKLFQKPDAPDPLKEALAEALVALDAKTAGPALLSWSGDHPEPGPATTVDPALARWRTPGAVDLWTNRLTDPAMLRPVRRSAARSLGQVAAASAGDALARLASDAQAPGDLRLLAAHARGRLPGPGAIDDAKALSNGSAIDRLAAVAVLGERSDGGVTLLQTMADDDEHAIAQAAAIRKLNQWSADVPGVDQRLGSPDQSVRLATVRSLEGKTAPAALDQMTRAMGDSSPMVRNQARRQMLSLGRGDAGPAVRAAIDRALAADPGWQGVEQLSLLVGELDYESAGQAIAGYLDHERPEARLAAATAVRLLRMNSLLPQIFQRAQTLTQFMQSNTDNPSAHDDAGGEATQLLMSIGQMAYAPADEMLRAYIPKNAPFPISARAAAVYALGRIHAGQNDPQLARQLIGRMQDMNPMTPESPEVQRFAAIALGRMGADKHVDALRRAYNGQMSSDDLKVAASWATEKITGTGLGPLDLARGIYSGFPLDLEEHPTPPPPASGS